MFDKLWKHVCLRRGWYLIGAFVFLGGVLYAAGLAIDFHIKQTTNQPSPFVVILVRNIGGYMLTGAISGAVLKVIAMEGFFLEAVSEVVHGERGWSRLSRPKLAMLWQDISRALYLKNMQSNARSAQIQDTIKHLKEALSEALKTKFPSSEAYFVDETSRTLEVRWADEAHTELIIREVTVSRTVPFDSRKRFEMKTRMVPEAGIDIKDYALKQPKLLLIDDPENKIESQTRPLASGEAETVYKTHLAREVYNIQRERNFVLRVLQDPNLITKAPFVVRKFEVMIRNHAEDLRILVNALGDADLIMPIDGERPVECGKHFSFKSRQLMLAGDGYIITFLKTSA